MRFPSFVYVLGNNNHILNCLGLFAETLRSIPASHPDRLALSRQGEFFLGGLIESNLLACGPEQVCEAISNTTFFECRRIHALVSGLAQKGLAVPDRVWSSTQKTFLRRLQLVSDYASVSLAVGSGTPDAGSAGGDVLWDMPLDELASRVAIAKGTLALARRQLARRS